MTKDCTIYNGDCLEKMQDIPSGSVDMIFTDLPYGCTDCAWDAIIPFDKLWEQYDRVCKENAAVVLTATQPFTTTVINSNIKNFRYTWVWVKPYTTGFLNANKMPLRNVEDACVFYRKLPTYNPQGAVTLGLLRTNNNMNSQDNGIYSGMKAKEEFTQKFTNHPRQTLEFDGEAQTVHPTQKPVALMEYFIKTYTNEGETVLDSTMGSASTGVAALRCGRKFIGVERDPEYFNICEKRLSEVSKNKEKESMMMSFFD